MNTLVMNSFGQPILSEQEDRARLVQAEKMSAAGNLLAGLVHELNNPLTTILGFSELLLNEDPSKRERIRTIHDEALRSVRIIQNVLRFARCENGALEIIDVNDAIRRTAELTGYQLRLNRIELELSLTPSCPKVIAHEGELTQVLLNLITNAIHAISAVRATGTVQVATLVSENSVRIAVKDDGPGVNSADLDRIFEPFFTTKPDGTGLGLHLSQKIIREIGGDIWVSTSKSYGTAFTIELPVVTDPKGGKCTSVSDDPIMTTASRSVLIVDDEDNITELIDTALTASGYETECRNDGGPAIDVLKDQEYDILICDLHMPGTSGREVIEWVRSHRPNVRTLLLSGDVSRKETEEIAKAYGAHFLAKPFNIAELRRAVQRLTS